MGAVILCPREDAAARDTHFLFITPVPAQSGGCPQGSAAPPSTPRPDVGCLLPVGRFVSAGSVGGCFNILSGCLLRPGPAPSNSWLGPRGPASRSVPSFWAQPPADGLKCLNAIHSIAKQSMVDIHLSARHCPSPRTQQRNKTSLPCPWEAQSPKRKAEQWQTSADNHPRGQTMPWG